MFEVFARRLPGGRRYGVFAGVGRLLDALRTADQPSKRIARQVWEVLVFMVWHGIFVEERIKPEIPETGYPVVL